jgi:hypothetical protein
VLETPNTLKCVGVQTMKMLRNLFATRDAYDLPPEAFDYDDDVTPEAVEILRKKAASVMNQGTWKVIEGEKLAK